jgi:hypothetical protein
MPVVFLHIPKTAGTSVTELMRHWYQDKRFCGHIFDAELKKTPPDQLAKFEVFAGHFNYNTIVNNIPKAKIFTFLREPRQRSLSLYNYWAAHSWEWIDSQGGRHAPHVRFAKTHSFLEVLQTDEPSVRNNFDNLYVRTFVPREFYDKMGKLVVTPQEALERAIKRAKNLIYIGFVDELGKSIEQLAQALGQTVPSEIPRRNTPEDGYFRPERGSFAKAEAYSTALSDEEEAALAANLVLDQQFFDFFKERFKASV